jgi:hypothetical protein
VIHGDNGNPVTLQCMLTQYAQYSGYYGSSALGSCISARSRPPQPSCFMTRAAQFIHMRSLPSVGGRHSLLVLRNSKPTTIFSFPMRSPCGVSSILHVEINLLVDRMAAFGFPFIFRDRSHDAFVRLKHHDMAGPAKLLYVFSSYPRVLISMSFSDLRAPRAVRRMAVSLHRCDRRFPYA